MSLFLLSGCFKGKIVVSISKKETSTVSSILEVTINQAITETVGTCSFTAASDPTASANFSYRVSFSKEISPASFIAGNIYNAGTGGGVALVWSITNCGDNKNFNLTATSVVGDGTIIPTLLGNSLVAANNSPSTSTDNSVTYDTTGPAVTINQAITETVGTCSFTAASDPTTVVGFSYRVTFNEVIDTATFTTADITNNGTGGGTLLTWTLANCGDDKNFKLTATAITGYGTIVPIVAFNSVQDLVGNNSVSSSSDNTVMYAGSGWYQEAYIKAVNNDANDWFGTAVALSADTLAVAAILESSNQTTITNGATASSDNSLSASGAIYVYKRAGSTWSQEAYIKAVNSNSNTYYGYGLSLFEDTLAVGAYGESSNQTTITNGATASSDTSSSMSGAVYVYKRTGSNWAQEAYIKPVNNHDNEDFGFNISLSKDTLAVGGFYEPSNQTTITNGSTASSDTSHSNSGAVYIYKRTGSNWAQQAYIKASNNDANDSFGYAVSLSGDTLAVGAFGESSNQTTITNGTSASSDNSNASSGAVYVYKRNGSYWEQEAYIKANNSDASDLFGYTVSVSGDTLAVGAYRESSNQTTITNGTTASSNNSFSRSGAVYVYKRTSNEWAQEAYIKAANANANDYYGVYVSLNGNTLVVGSQSESSNQTTITNGATANADNSLSSSGAVYVYKRTGSNWAQEAFIKASNADANDYFGMDPGLQMSADTIAVGSQNESSNQTTITNGDTASTNNSNASSGAVYVYRNASRLFDPPSFMATMSAATSITLSWQSAGIKATGYKIAYALGMTPPADCSSGTVINAGNVLTYNVTGLTEGKHYSFRICSYDASTTSEGYTTTFETASSVSEPINFSATASPISATLSIGLSWTSGGGSTTGFKIAYNSQSPTPPVDCSSGTIIDVGNVTSYTLTGSGISAGNYGIRLCAYDGTGKMSFGQYASVALLGGWYQEAYIKAVNADANDQFGAYGLSINGDTLAVGSINESSNQTTITNGATASSNNANSDSGAVYVYKRTGASWTQEAYVKAANNNNFNNAYFGISVSLDKDTLVVGENVEPSNQTTITNGDTASNDTTLQNAGAVFVYKRSGVNWTQEAYIKPPSIDTDDQFGISVSLNDNTLAVGAFGESSNQTTITNGPTASADNSHQSSGAVYVYRRSGVNWAQEAYIKASNNNNSDRFGYSVSIDRDTLVVGSYNEDSNQTIITNGTTSSADNSSLDSGAVYVYKRSGTTWSQEAYIKAVNNDANDNFGLSVSISGDLLAVGAYGESSDQTTITNGATASGNNANTDSGAVYVYKRTGTTWAQEAYVKASNNLPTNYEFGLNLSLKGDTLVVGEEGEGSNQTTITNGATSSVDTSRDYSGAAFVYKRTGTSWAQEAYIKASNADVNDSFGYAVSISGDTIVVGAYGEASNQTTITNGSTASSDNSKANSGAVYVYRNNGLLFEVTDIWGTSTSSSITLNWNKTGGTAVGYYYAYRLGATAPATCQSDTWVDVGDVGTDTITGLSSSTTYTFRICAYDATLNTTNGWTKSVTTAP